jgi:hypothetical protein
MTGLPVCLRSRLQCDRSHPRRGSEIPIPPSDPVAADAHLEAYLEHYTHVRPNAGLRYQTPAAYLHLADLRIRLTSLGRKLLDERAPRAYSH